jgi:hypothetical protein
LIPYSVDILAAAGQKLPADAGLPALLLPPIRDLWQVRPGAMTVAAVLAQPSEDAWAAVGSKLTGYLLRGGGAAGLSVDGICPPGWVIAWLQQIAASAKPGEVALRWSEQRHPMSTSAIGINTAWNSLQATGSATWLTSLWRTTTSRWFDQAVDLMLLIYGEDVLVEAPGSGVLTEGPLFSTIGRARAWLAPFYDNRGFYLGLMEGSPLYSIVTGGGDGRGP